MKNKTRLNLKRSNGLRISSIIAFSGLVLCESGVNAVLIQPDSVTASSFYNASYAPEHTIDGSGLPVGFGPGDAHADYAAGNHWTTAFGSQPGDAWITWGFNTAETLDRIYLWNHRSTQPPAEHSQYEVVLFDLTLYDGSNNVLLSLNDVSLAPETATAQTFLFGGAIAGVRSVRLDVEKNQGPTQTYPYTGLAEVAFNRVASSVPDAGSTLLLSGMAGVFLVIGRSSKFRRARN